jgi:hypothetical protein
MSCCVTEPDPMRSTSSSTTASRSIQLKARARALTVSGAPLLTAASTTRFTAAGSPRIRVIDRAASLTMAGL